jgi:adenylyltransferase/sulfurtransferase
MHSISCNELKIKLEQQQEILLIDVREQFERDHFNIGGIHLPLQLIFENIYKIPNDKTVVFYCQKGIRSQIAIQRLNQRFGYNNLVNLQGGMDAWRKLKR